MADILGDSPLAMIRLFLRRNFYKIIWLVIGLFVSGVAYDWTRYDYQVIGNNTWIKHDSRTGLTLICFVPDARTANLYKDDMLGCDQRLFVGPLEALIRRVEEREEK
jgi:hypothetical protein